MTSADVTHTLFRLIKSGSWAWTPVCSRGLSENLPKRYFGQDTIQRRIGDLNYEGPLDGRHLSSLRTLRPDVVHVVRLDVYFDC